MSPLAVLGIIAGISFILYVFLRNKKKDNTVDTFTDFIILDEAFNMIGD